MSPQRTILSALQSVGANKLRSLLTLLGIVIGVAAVISLMSIGRGVQESVTSFIQDLGTNILFVSPAGGDLTLDDAYALADPVLAPSVDQVAPEINVFGDINTTDEFGARTVFAGDHRRHARIPGGAGLRGRYREFHWDSARFRRV